MQKLILADLENMQQQVETFFNTSVVDTTKVPSLVIVPKTDYPLDIPASKLSKRVFDVLFSGFVIIFILSWLIPILALFIKLTSKGPVFFKQERTGINNKNFICWKLRTMYVNGDADLKQAVAGDPRITLAGKFMRKFSLDETPQFVNVLLGCMSIVGPRPHMLRHTEKYSKQVDNYMLRHFVKPGITGLAQVKGCRGEISAPAMLHNRVRFDIFYLKNWNFILDIAIIFKTMKLVLLGDKNAY